MPAVVLNDEGANEKTGSWNGKKKRRPIGMLNGRKHHRDHQHEGNQGRDQLLDCKAWNRAAILLAVRGQTAHALFLRFRHRIRCNDGSQSLIAAKVGTAFRAKRRLEAEVQGLGPP